MMIYNEYRPKTFDEVIGQESNVTVLRKQVMNNTVPNALLLYGHHGCGKTTIARILAKAVNCEHPVNGNPCGACACCKAVEQGSADIIEIDAASNNSVESVRTMIQEASYLPVQLKYKIYIIDEVHMLSTAAFNALLKTLEEPPERTKFFLATTEQHKVPATIQSRCSKHLFRSMHLEELIERVRYVLQEKGISMDEDAIHLIAKAADGAMRDALSILEQAITSGCTSLEQVQAMVGLLPEDYLFDVIEAYGKRDLHAILTALVGLSSEQLSDKIIAGSITDICVDRIAYLAGGADVLSLNKTSDYINRVANLGLSNTECLALLDILCDGQHNLKHAFVSAVARIEVLEQPTRIVEEAIKKLGQCGTITEPTVVSNSEPIGEVPVPEQPEVLEEDIIPGDMDDESFTSEPDEECPFDETPVSEEEMDDECPFDEEPEEYEEPVTEPIVKNPFAGFRTGFPF